ASSLLSGNFTGNHAILSPRIGIIGAKSPLQHAFLKKFPMQIIRERFKGIREFLYDNSDLTHL
ncbi:hypothetical protein ACQ1Z2_16345, partial [Enterococcus faecalis]|uniref:hypothetical protein n=1 Tax=Enterococcus faecalis TaxID=1351 RepID=UPI003D6BD312